MERQFILCKKRIEFVSNVILQSLNWRIYLNKHREQSFPCL